MKMKLLVLISNLDYNRNVFFFVTSPKNPQCKVCGETPVIRSSKHLFLDLPKVTTMYLVLK